MTYLEQMCGIFGATNIRLQTVINALTLLQHRGREAAGIAHYSSSGFDCQKGPGLVSQALKSVDGAVTADLAIGHTRYSTRQKTVTSDSAGEEAQPLRGFHPKLGEFWLVHNGNIPNIEDIRQEHGLPAHNSDSKILTDLLAGETHYERWWEVLVYLLNKVEMVYCLLILTSDAIYALRDRRGVRPLCIGKSSDGYCVASESCALQNYEWTRDIGPGEIVKLSNGTRNDCESIYQMVNPGKQIFCSFEYIYFMTHTSVQQGRRIESVRWDLGQKLGMFERTSYKPNSVVLAMPNTAIPGAKGFADALSTKWGHRIEYKDYIKKTPGIGRTFILPNHQ